jgi:hypothetical protein
MKSAIVEDRYAEISNLLCDKWMKLTGLISRAVEHHDSKVYCKKAHGSCLEIQRSFNVPKQSEILLGSLKGVQPFQLTTADPQQRSTSNRTYYHPQDGHEYGH